MRLDHLLSKEEEVGVLDTVECFMGVQKHPSWFTKLSGADALKGHTRSHPEHDG